MRRALPLSLAVLATALAACGDDAQESTRVHGETLTVYASLPAHGVEARVGRAAELGMREALREAGGKAGGREVRLVRLPSTRPGDEQWDPGTVEANAERAADDPTTIAYLGELDQGGSAVSLPVTNRESILQVSPADGLTSYTRTPPGRPKAGPERYYPEQTRSFVRLVRPDLDVAREIARELKRQDVSRLAVLHGDGIADRELEAMALALIGTGPPEVVIRTDVGDGDPEDVAELVEEVAAATPDAILYAAPTGATASRLLLALRTQLLETPILGGPPLALGIEEGGLPSNTCALTAVPRPSRTPPAAHELLVAIDRAGGGNPRSEALLGYEAMRLTLAAIDDAGPDRAKVVRAAHAPGVRRGVFGSYEITKRGDIVVRSPAWCTGYRTPNIPIPSPPTAP